MKVVLAIVVLALAFTTKVQAVNAVTLTQQVSKKKQPQFPGGIKAWKQFLTKNLKFPPDDGTDYAITVFVSFVVEKDGRLTDIKALKNICPKCNDEALRLIKLSPNWLPAKLYGKAVRSKYVIPIRFDLCYTE